MSCPKCEDAARFVSYRPRTVQGLLGAMRLERAYYHCRSCHAGHCPWDQTLDLDAAASSPAAREAASLAGAVEAFGPAAHTLLHRLAGLRLSASTVRRVTEAVGADVGRRLAAGETFDEAADWAWHKDAQGKACAYVSIDATGTRQQAPGGGTAEGRTVAVAMVYNPVPEDRDRWARPETQHRPAWQARYVASLEGQATLGEPLRRQAAQVGMDVPSAWIAISDGGAGLEDWLRTNFGRLDAVILDFYHVAERLAELANTWHGVGSEAAQEQFAAWTHRLEDEGEAAALLEELQSLKIPRRAALRELHHAVVGYVSHHVYRMDYPTYRAQGWPIGSGPVEAACKTVIGRRLKGTGMRWRPHGSNALSHLRALLVGEPSQRTAYWNSRKHAA